MSSPYRDADVPSEVPTTEEDAPVLARIDVSGRPGVDGGNGIPGHSYGASGYPGSPGGDAGPASPGESAGVIAIALIADDAAGAVSVHGQIILPHGEKRDVRQLLVVGEAGQIKLAAIGGGGGKGGNGGRGGDGTQGANGADATRWSDGTDGQSGGNGGPGGNATSGARAGDGGNIVITCAEDDTPLLMLIDHDIRGGQGGAAGTNGPGGFGGLGGSGGSSYSWTTTSTSRNSDGSTRTNTHYHSNAGGSSGSNGSTGPSGSARVVAGANGEVGTFAIKVTSDKRGTISYPSRYDLRLVSFEHDNLNEDAVYEPREIVRVFDLEVENAGGMPTPMFDELSLALAKGGWIEPQPGELKCKPGLGPGERHIVKGELRFRIADHTPTEPGAPLEVEETILQRAMLPSVKREFANYQEGDALAQGTFVIRYPVRLSPIDNLVSLAAGEATRVRFIVTNQSRFALGATTATKRVVRVHVFTAPDSELGDEHVELVIGEQVLPPQAGWKFEIPELGAGEERVVELAVRVKPSAPEYLRFAAHVALELGDLEAPASPRPIQLRAFDIRVARPFAVSDADALLVVNHRTTREEIEAWEQVGERLAFNIAIWDLSRERHLDLERPLSDGIALADWFAHKALIVLDNEIEGPDGATTYPHVFLSDDQAARAASAGIDVALIGKGMPLERILLPPVPTDAAPEIEVTRSFWVRWWAKPQKDWLVEQARKRSAELFAEKPTQRHVVVHRFDPKLDEKSSFANKWRVGTLRELRTLDAALGGVVHANAPTTSVHDPSWITGPEVTRTVLAMFGFGENLERLRRLLAREEVTADSLAPVIDALVLDVATELSALIAPGWKGESSGSDIYLSLTRLDELARSHLTAPFDSVGGNALRELSARVAFLGGSQIRWWEQMPPFRWMRRGPSASSKIEFYVDTFLTHAFPDNPKEARADVERITDALHATWKTEKKSSLANSRRDWALEQAKKPIAAQTVTSDVEVLAQWEERVMSGEEYDAVTTTRANDTAMRARLLASAETQHDDLFIARPKTEARA